MMAIGARITRIAAEVVSRSGCIFLCKPPKQTKLALMLAKKKDTKMLCRDRFVVIWFSLLYIITWAFSMSGELRNRFWDQRYNLQRLVEEPKEELEYGLEEITKSYYSNRRYYYFVPHVIGAIFWWNLYFLQLIPKVRRCQNKKFHRMLGRFLMVVLIVQNVTGFGLAATTKSHIVKLVSYVLCIASLFCVVQAWRYAYYRDIPKHKHWVIRLVGYMQTISLQRFWLGMLIVPHALGWNGLYPPMDDDSTDEEWAALAAKMFDDSFVLCITTAFLTTEWYLAAEQGMTAPAIDKREEAAATAAEKDNNEEEEEVDYEVNHEFDDKEQGRGGGELTTSSKTSNSDLE